MVIPNEGVADPGLSREVDANLGGEGGAPAIFCITQIPMKFDMHDESGRGGVPNVLHVKNPSPFLH